MSKVNFFDQHTCWEWRAGKNPNGYGLFYYRNSEQNKEEKRESARQYYYSNIIELRKKSLERYHIKKNKLTIFE